MAYSTYARCLALPCLALPDVSRMVASEPDQHGQSVFHCHRDPVTAGLFSPRLCTVSFIRSAG